VVVVAPDQPRLFSRVVGVLSLHGHDVRSARARSMDGMAISEFDVRPHLDQTPDWSSFQSALTEALDGHLELGAGLARRAERYGRLQRPTAAHVPEPLVMIDNQASTTATILEIRAADKVGVLFRIARVLADQGLDIRHAKVSTLGAEVIDTFYVVGADEQKLTASEALAGVTDAIRAAVV
jgi:[protein-PII] uridylyltransferase